MAEPQFDDQDDFFYDHIWSKEVTIFLIDHLVNQVHTKKWVWNKPNIPAIRLVRDHVNVTFELYYTEQQVVHPVAALRQRFQTFEKLINSPRVFWNKDNNYIYASPNTWTSLIQEDEMVQAYMHQGEPLYRSLELLFKFPRSETDNIPVYRLDNNDEESNSDEDPGRVPTRTIWQVPSQNIH